MKKAGLIITSLIVLLLSSCDRQDCKNTNPIFDNFSINSEEYISELVNQISKNNSEDLEYWFEEYLEEKGKEYLIVNVQNDSICAKMKIQVKNWNGIEAIKKTKGESYQGAKLDGLTFDIEIDSINTDFIFKNIERVID